MVGTATLAAGDVGAKNFETADIVIRGVELAEKIKKGQFKRGKLGAPRDAPRDLASRVGGLISIGNDTTTATEIVATPNLRQSPGQKRGRCNRL